MRTVQWTGLAAAERQRLLTRPAIRDGRSIAAQAAAIIERVRQEGDVALRELTTRFDRVVLSELQVNAEEFAWAEAALTSAQRQAIGAAAENIATFHRAQQPADLTVTTAAGVTCERVTRPIPRVGLYVPAGSAPLPSTALMLAVPAALAECPRIVICTPPRADGRADPAVLVAAQAAGVDEVYKVGGAQAIAAMAYGTATVPKVDKIFGPGNAWVTAAKVQVAQDPGGAALDIPAGPSEVLVIADDGADAGFVASDLLSQAEHGPDSQVVLVTTSAALAEATVEQVQQQLTGLSRRGIAEQALAASTAILVADLEQAFAVSNAYGPEHLILQIAEPRRWLDRVNAAGSVFLGPWAPESIGDYCSGTNHVLPTYGFARNHSSLGLTDFLRSMTVQELTPDGLRLIGPTAQTLAELEGLDAHGNAVALRLAALDAETRP
jgi:histidinol dehydrogenase